MRECGEQKIEKGGPWAGFCAQHAAALRKRISAAEAELRPLWQAERDLEAAPPAWDGATAARPGAGAWTPQCILRTAGAVRAMTIAGEGLTQPTLLAVSCGEETFLWLQQGQRDGDSSTAPWAFRSEWHFVRRLAFGADHLGFLPPLRLVAASSDCVRIHDLDEDVAESGRRPSGAAS